MKTVIIKKELTLSFISFKCLDCQSEKRMHAWCSSLDGIKYALLTGDTQIKKATRRKGLCQELISRANEIHRHKFCSKPTMLEYMLVRNTDVQSLKKSKAN
jgi:hypothetical protein